MAWLLVLARPAGGVAYYVPPGIGYFAQVSGSRTTLAGWLARMGFADAARAELLLLNDLGTPAAELRTDPVVAAIAAAADPDLALTGMARLFAATPARTPCAPRSAPSRTSANG